MLHFIVLSYVFFMGEAGCLASTKNLAFMTRLTRKARAALAF
jgi:hypothetical protein